MIDDLVEFELVVQRGQTDDEQQDEPDPRIRGRGQTRRPLCGGDAVAGIEVRHERRHDADPAEHDGQQRSARFDGLPRIEMWHLVENLVVPDEVADAERQDRPDDPHQEHVALLHL
ncbi:MAG TPA: hypothetical protein VII33_10225 [Nakamurella sp.]